MNNKSNTWTTSSTTTRNWNVSDLTPEQRDKLDSLMAGGIGGTVGSQTWHYASHVDGDDFVVDMKKNGAVTVNGREYGSMDQVPEAERQRIATLRAGFAAGDSLLDMFKAVDIDNVGAETIQRGAGRPAHDPTVLAQVDTWSAGPDETGRFSGNPGQVPQGNVLRVLSRVVLACIVVGAMWLVARGVGVV